MTSAGKRKPRKARASVISMLSDQGSMGERRSYPLTSRRSTQRPLSRGVPRPELVHELARGAPRDRGLAARLQPAPAAHEPADAHTGRGRRRPTLHQAAPARDGCIGHRPTTRARCRHQRAGVIEQLRILLMPGPTKGAGSRRQDEVRRSAMRTTTWIWFGLGASALVLGASWAREPASWMPELARAAHAQASTDCPKGSTAP